MFLLVLGTSCAHPRPLPQPGIAVAAARPRFPEPEPAGQESAKDHAGPVAVERRATNPEGKLVAAVLEGDLAAVQAALGEGASPETKDEFGHPALLLAISRNLEEGVSEKIIRLLVDKGASLATRSSSQFYEGETALMNAAREGRAGLVQALLDMGADVDARSRSLETALMNAAMWGHLDIARMLVGKGADVNARSNLGITPLRQAAARGHPEVAEYLLAHGAEVNATDGFTGESPLITAAREGHGEVVRVLLARGADATLRSWKGRTAMTEAACWGRPTAIKALFDKGVKVYYRHLEVVKKLLAKGANVNLKRADGSTALVVAVENAVDDEDVEMVKALLAKGADVNAQMSDGSTVVMNHPDITKLAREAGASGAPSGDPRPRGGKSNPRRKPAARR